MKSVLSYPGTMRHAQEIARALHEQKWLEAFVTTYAFHPGGLTAAVLGRLPSVLSQRIRPILSRRAVDSVPLDQLHCYPFWEVARMVAQTVRSGPVAVDQVWDRMSHGFDELVARRYVPRVRAVHAFEYTALASFQAAQKAGVARILHLPSLSSRQFETIRQRELDAWPEMADTNAAYFAGKFAERHARRMAEIALADVIIANSQLTARSHIAGGADPAKVVVASLGAPMPLPEEELPESSTGPLSVMWAGNFTLRKGAHYLLQAWRRIGAGGHARLDVYGQRDLPERVIGMADDTVTFHGSVPRDVLYRAYRDADVLVCASLSDGFGMVITEALAHGLPVITTDMTGAADLVTAECGIVIPAANAQALTDALRWCLDNRRALHAMRSGALKAARGRQWADFRHDVIAGVRAGTIRAGYDLA